MAKGISNPEIDLVGVTELLHEHLTGALVASAYEALREDERRRVWTLERMVAFWTAVILRAPPSLSAALREASGAGWGTRRWSPPTRRSSSVARTCGGTSSRRCLPPSATA
ncbi:MAG: hypothetical protein R3E85_13800 [Planctomycetota bacterium]